MGGDWAAKIAFEQRRELARLRRHADVEVAQSEEGYWVRGPLSNEDAISELFTVPRAKLFHLDSGGSLKPWGKRLATGRLPELKFVPIEHEIRPRIPIAAYPAGRVEKIRIGLVRSDQPRSASILMTTVPAWCEYASAAPAARLARWTFAASADQRVIVRGEPIPPLPGQQYWEIDSVALPVGWTSAPLPAGPVLSQITGAAADILVLLAIPVCAQPAESESRDPLAEPPQQTDNAALIDCDGILETVPCSVFVKASRSAARSTLRTLSDDER